MARTAYDLQRESNSAVKDLMDTLVSLNAEKVEAERQGWNVEFTVNSGDVDVMITRSAWPILDKSEQSA